MSDELIVQIVFLLPALVISLSLHEFAHAWSSSLLGDDYPRRQGRVSLNPFRHLSLMGTLALFVLNFGWGKPVEVNLYNFKHPKRDFLITSLAGPFANLVIASTCLGLMLLTRRTYSFGPIGAVFLPLGHSILALLVLLNILLAVFNLLPVPPLDGSKIWPCLIPQMKAGFGPGTTRIFMVILILLIVTDQLDPIFDTAFNAVDRIMPISDGERFEKLIDHGAKAVKRQQYKQAENTLTEALRINRWSAEGFAHRAFARWKLDNLSGALEDLNRAIQLDKTDPEYYESRAEILEMMDRPDQSRKDRETAKALRTLAPATSTPTSQPVS